MKTRIAIDPNIRVRGNGTYAGFEDADGPLVVGDIVEVFEPESDLVGKGSITDVDNERELVYLSVEWASLKPRARKAPCAPRQPVHYYMPPLLVLVSGCGINHADTRSTMGTCVEYEQVSA